MMSFVCEKYFGFKWWDYSNLLLNINGRTCLFYAVSWGLLAILLIKKVNPNFDKFINILKKKNNFFKMTTSFLIIFFAMDAIITGYALKVFYYRIVSENNLEIVDFENVKNKYSKIKNSKSIANFLNTHYDDEKMLVNYPNIMVQQSNNKSVNIDSLLSGINSYYYRLGDALKK